MRVRIALFKRIIHLGLNGDTRICHVCNIDFKYPSKLARHLQTAKHQAFEANLECTEATDYAFLHSNYESDDNVVNS